MTTPRRDEETQALLVQVLELLERQEQRQLKLERSLEQLQDTAAMVIEMSDAYAAQATGGGGALSDALRRLATDQLVHPQPHPLAVALYHSHPPLVERLRALAR